MTLNMAPQTIAAANGIATDSTFGSVAPPLYLSSTFAFAGFEQARSYQTAHHRSR
jgi:cystathionine gamma-synthase